MICLFNVNVFPVSPIITNLFSNTVIFLFGNKVRGPLDLQKAEDSIQ